MKDHILHLIYKEMHAGFRMKGVGVKALGSGTSLEIIESVPSCSPFTQTEKKHEWKDDVRYIASTYLIVSKGLRGEKESLERKEAGKK